MNSPSVAITIIFLIIALVALALFAGTVLAAKTRSGRVGKSVDPADSQQHKSDWQETLPVNPAAPAVEGSTILQPGWATSTPAGINSQSCTK